MLENPLRQHYHSKKNYTFAPSAGMFKVLTLIHSSKVLTLIHSSKKLDKWTSRLTACQSCQTEMT